MISMLLKLLPRNLCLPAAGQRRSMTIDSCRPPERVVLGLVLLNPNHIWFSGQVKSSTFLNANFVFLLLVPVSVQYW
jgi:hypothetical protein